MFFGDPLRLPLGGQGGWLADRALTILALVGISMPVFWLAAILLIYLTFKIELFPSGGYVALTEDPLEWANHLILPWITLAILYVGFYSRVLRSNMLDVMNEDYVRTARAKGLGERQVMTRHVLRNSLIPIVTLFGLDFGALVGGGAILTEALFSLDGVGQYAAESIGNLDLPPLMAVTLFGAFFVVLFNTLVDIAYAYLDPRVRLGSLGARMSAAAAALRSRTCGSASPPKAAALQAVDGVSFDLAAGRGAGDRRRVGLGQERHRADDHRPDPLAQRADRGLGAAARQRADRRRATTELRRSAASGSR